jgi:hypothetical protein
MEAIGLSLHAMQLVADKHLCSVAVSCLLCPCMLRALHLLQIGLVSQEPLLFSVLSNIMYGKPDATMAEVRV